MHFLREQSGTLYDGAHETLPAAEDMMYTPDNCGAQQMARALPPTYLPISPPCLAEKLREIADLLEQRSTLIRTAERHYTTGSRGEPVTVIHIEVREESE